MEYEPVRLGGKEVTLPVKVTVRDGKDGPLLRSVRMMNFEQIELDAAEAEEAARRFGAVIAEEREYDRLRVKYWKKAPSEIDKQDVEAIEQLQSRFEKAAAAAGISTGEKLKYLNILTRLSVILGDKSRLQRCYKNYLSTLAENKLRWMTLVGGYGVIETLMFAEQRSDAEKLLSPWVNAVLDMHDAESILLFARRQLAKNRLWPTIKLLEAFASKEDCPPEARFEAEALRCTALGKLCKLLRSDDIAKEGRIAEVQANWVASVGADGVNRMFAGSIDRARRSFASLREPTEFQKALKKQLDKIEQEMSGN